MPRFPAVGSLIDASVGGVDVVDAFFYFLVGCLLQGDFEGLNLHLRLLLTG